MRVIKVLPSYAAERMVRRTSLPSKKYRLIRREDWQERKLTKMYDAWVKNARKRCFLKPSAHRAFSRKSKRRFVEYTRLKPELVRQIAPMMKYPIRVADCGFVDFADFDYIVLGAWCKEDEAILKLFEFDIS